MYETGDFKVCIGIICFRTITFQIFYLKAWSESFLINATTQFNKCIYFDNCIIEWQ